MASLVAIVIFLPIVVVCCGVGARLLRTLRLPCSRGAEEVLFALPIGMGLVAYLVLGLGLLGLLRWWAALAVLAALAALALKDIRRLAVALAMRLARPRGRLSLAAGVGAFFLLLMAVLTLLGALAPAGQNDWDGLSYHLAVPKIYVQHGRIGYLPWVSHSNFPFTAEMLYALGLLLDGQRLAKLFHWLAGLLVVAGALHLGRLASPGRAGLAAAVVLAATPVLAWEATTAGNDLTVALFTVLALAAMVRWAQTDHRAWLWTSGIACGLALGTKPTSLVLMLFLCAAAFWQVWRRWGRPAGGALGAAGILALIACLVGSPWYIKSQLWTGDPVYPFFYEVFGGRYWSADAARLYRAEQLSFGMGHGLLAFILYPWNLTVHPQRFFNFPDKPLIYVSIGPLYLGLIPLLLLVGRPGRVTRFLLAFGAVFSVGWFALSQHIRYFIPLLPVAAVLAGIAAARAAQSGRALRLLVGGVLGVVALVAVGIAALAAEPGVRAAIGIESDEAYLQRTLDVYPVMSYANRYLPPDAKVLTLGETRGFYLDREYLWGDPGQHEMFRYDRYRTADELVNAWAQRGVTHVLIGLGFMRALRDPSSHLARLFDEAITTGRLRPVGVPVLPGRERASLYRLAPASGGRP